MHIGFTPEFAERLRADLRSKGIELHPASDPDSLFELERALGVDMLVNWVGWANCYYQDFPEYVDEWGVGWRSVPYSTPFGAGRYTEMVHHPLATDQAVASYRAPDPLRPQLYESVARVLRDYRADYWIVGATVCTIFECAWALRGFERLLMDFARNPEIAHAILRIPFEYHLAAAKRLVEMGVDMIWIGDDVGSQRAMLISPAHWRKYLKPLMAEFISEIKTLNPALKVAYHSDGLVTPIIPELIEIGLDILNPIQPACMDPAKLKTEFGDRLCFWGSIDEQFTLPFGAPEQVRQEVLLRLNTIGKGGGLIIGPTHHVQLDTPMENFWTMVETIQNTPYH
jgi:uroporphyrinogen decarboxylase